MCVIIHDPEGKELDFAILQRAVERNADGWGLSMVDPQGNIRVARGFGFKQAKRAWKRSAGAPRVFHARIGTSGTKNIENCHPFDASHDASERRIFFHNGTVDIPRIDESMCDSWHLAKYIQGFPTSEELVKRLMAYAIKEHSRFVFVTPKFTARLGEGWFQRDGVYYSNPSALADIRSFNGGPHNGQGRGWYTKGLLEDTSVEVTSDKSYEGLGWDAERKLYSNKVKTVKSTGTGYTSRHDHHSDYTRIMDGMEATMTWNPTLQKYDVKPGSEKAIRPYVRGVAQPLALQKDDAASARGESVYRNHELTMTTLEQAPWMNNAIGEAGYQQSWPNRTVFGYDQVKHGLGHCYTHRYTSPHMNGAWREAMYKDGNFVMNRHVDGPFLGGLVITGKSDKVTYDGKEMSLTSWRIIVKHWVFPELAFGEVEDGEASDVGAKFLKDLKQVVDARAAAADHDNSIDTEVIPVITEGKLIGTVVISKAMDGKEVVVTDGH